MRAYVHSSFLKVDLPQPGLLLQEKILTSCETKSQCRSCKYSSCFTAVLQLNLPYCALSTTLLPKWQWSQGASGRNTPAKTPGCDWNTEWQTDVSECSSGGLGELTLTSTLTLQWDQMTKRASSHLFPACSVMDLGGGCVADWAVGLLDVTDSAAKDKHVTADKGENKQKSFAVSETPASSIFLCLRIIDLKVQLTWEGQAHQCHPSQTQIVFRLLWRKPQLCDM